MTLDDLTLDTCDFKNIEHFDMEWFILYLDPSSRSMNSRNTYLVCRMFWCDDAVHSDICWNDPQPPYNFSQVCIKRKIFYRVCGNVTLMHVWCTMYLVKKNFCQIITYCICQIAPVLVSQSLLERMRNNFMVVEIWDKKTNAENDKVGYLKQFG